MAPASNFHDELEEWESRIAELSTPSTRTCRECVTDSDLWAAVSSKGKQGVCDFCSSSGSCVTFEDLAAILEDVLEQHYLTVKESGAFHDEGEWSERVSDVPEILDGIL